MPTAAPRLRVDDFDYALPTDAIAQAPGGATRRLAPAVLVLARSRPGRPHLRTRPFATSARSCAPATCWSPTTRGSSLQAAGAAAHRWRCRGPRPAADRGWLRPLGGADSPVPHALRVGDGSTLRNGDAARGGGAACRLASRAVRFFRDPHGRDGGGRRDAAPPYIRGRAAPADATRPSTPSRPAPLPRRPPGCTSRQSCSPHWSGTASVGQPSRCTWGSTRSGRSRANSWRSTRSIASGTRSRRPRGSGHASYANVRRTGGGGRDDHGAHARDGTPTWIGCGVERAVHHAALRVHAGRRADHQLPPAAQLAAAAGDGLGAGRDAWGDRRSRRATRCLEAYRVALDGGYRFFSFGDAMLIV